MTKKWVRVLGWIAVGATSLFFIQNGIQKLAGTSPMVEMFRELGYPDWARFAVGCVELAGAVLMALPRLTLYGASLLSVLMLGAVLTEFSAGHGFEAVLAGQWLVVVLVTAGVRYRVLSRKRTKENGMRQ
ncbi:DoxX family membrane protein [Cohnella sp. CFH 77786]|nr:DoxX family membrane protein [Cohnella sp. CFH 77786]